MIMYVGVCDCVCETLTVRLIFCPLTLTKRQSFDFSGTRYVNFLRARGFIGLWDTGNQFLRPNSSLNPDYIRSMCNLLEFVKKYVRLVFRLLDLIVCLWIVESAIKCFLNNKISQWNDTSFIKLSCKTKLVKTRSVSRPSIATCKRYLVSIYNKIKSS